MIEIRFCPICGKKLIKSDLLKSIRKNDYPYFITCDCGEFFIRIDYKTNSYIYSVNKSIIG